ncbi:MAG: cytochrome c biogenesis protein CcdA [bacterium]
MNRAVLAAGLCLIGTAAALAAEDPFAVSARWEVLNGREVVSSIVTIPQSHHLFADEFIVETLDGEALSSLTALPSVLRKDQFSGQVRAQIERSFSVAFGPPVKTAVLPDTIRVRYQGCSETACFFPRALIFHKTAPALPSEHGGDAAEKISTVTTARASGYLTSSELLSFLDRAEGLRAVKAGRVSAVLAGFSEDPLGFSGRAGLPLTLLLILLGGFLLNLTPCVLPMIPITLAILGAGAQAKSRWRGLVLGSIYGAAMALVYGGVGIAVALSGGFFGTVQSSPWFSVIVALLFVALGLAMFDLFTLDFSRFQTSGGGQPSPRGGWVAALGMGALAAVLAGACVAPVVLAVLVLAGALYRQGQPLGLLLPFVLGVGMALPWPFAGAGLTVLPRPGAWMVTVKRAFGVLIMLMALYYASLAWAGFRGTGRTTHDRENTPDVVWLDAAAADTTARLAGLAAQGRPVFLDFWAGWCKNCEAMDASTFRREAVRRRLAGYLVVKVQAERPDQSPARELLSAWGVQGLPTYVVLRTVGGR